MTSSNIRKPSFFWKGLYKCIDSNCSTTFTALIKQEPVNNGIIEVSWNNNGIFHEKKLIKPPRLTGNERKSTQKELMIKGIKNVKLNNILENRDFHEIRGIF